MSDLSHYFLQDVQWQIQQALRLLRLSLNRQGLLPFAFPHATRAQSRTWRVGLMTVLVEARTDVLDILGRFRWRIWVWEWWEHGRGRGGGRFGDLRSGGRVVSCIVFESRRGAGLGGRSGEDAGGHGSGSVHGVV